MKWFEKNNRGQHGLRAAALAFMVFVLGFAGVALAGGTGSFEAQTKILPGGKVIRVQHRGPPEGRGPMHGGGHCRGMDHEGGCGRGMHHGGGQAGEAVCPQPRQTVQAPDEFFNLKNPLKNTRDNVEHGRRLFLQDVQPSCAMCHGAKGDGTGGFGADMSPKPRNFTCAETMKPIPDGQLFWVIQNGSPDTGMPPFRDLNDEQIWQLVLYLKSLPAE